MKPFFLLLLLSFALAPWAAVAQGRLEPSSGAKASVRAPAPAVRAPAARRLAPAEQKALEESLPIDDDPTVELTPELLEVARAVYIGEMKCELGASVTVRAARRTGFFVVLTRGARFLMYPVESRTGAVRLEDRRRGAMWLQLGNKSMLMSQKLGKRLADECQGPEQVTFAEHLKRNPAPSLLDGHGPMHRDGRGPMHGQGHGPMHGHGAAVQEAPGAAPQASLPAPDPAPAPALSDRAPPPAETAAPSVAPAEAMPAPPAPPAAEPPAAVPAAPAVAAPVAPPAAPPPALTPAAPPAPPPLPMPAAPPSPFPTGPVFGDGA